MTRLTACIIFNTSDEDLEVITFKAGKQWAFYVGCIDETPSGCKRPRALLSSPPVYGTEDEAQVAASQAIEFARKAGTA